MTHRGGHHFPRFSKGMVHFAVGLPIVTEMYYEREDIRADRKCWQMFYSM
jgi:hypothetical protein